MRRRLPSAGLVLALGMAACTTWTKQPVPAPPAAFRSMRGPVHVTLVDQRSLYLVNVVIATDSLFGTSADIAAIRQSVPLTEVTRIDEQRKSPGRSMLLILGILVLAVTF